MENTDIKTVDERGLRAAAEARVKELEAQLADTQRQLGQEMSLQEDGHRFRHMMFCCVDWHQNGKDDDAVMLSFGPYKSHTLRASVDEAAEKARTAPTSSDMESGATE